MNYFLGIDCGGTFIKAALFNEKGEIQSCYRQTIEIISDKVGYAERDTAHLWQVCAEVIKHTISTSQLSPDVIKDVSISAQGKGAFLLDKNNKPFARAILSSDQRAIEIVKGWQAQQIPEKIYPLTRQTLWTGHPVSILRWLKENDSDSYHNIGAVFMTHDYLRFCLTDTIFCEETNISESNLYNMNTLSYDSQLAQLLGIPEIIEKLPPIIRSDQVAGYVTQEVAAITGLNKGTPVFGGLFDVVSAAICSGIGDDTEEKLNIILGTWSVVSGVTAHIDQHQRLPFVYGKYINHHQFIVHEASPTSAANLEWFVKQWQLEDYQTINQMVSELPPAQNSVFFIPFLYGSNMGLGMKAGFYGLQSYHTKAHLLQAIYEGVLFSLMLHLERMLQRFPKINRLRVSGGATQSAVWMQMLADLTGITLEIPQIEEAGCLGAALVAIKGALGQLPEDCLQHYPLQCYVPNRDNWQAYQDKYQQYKKLVEVLMNL